MERFKIWKRADFWQAAFVLLVILTILPGCQAVIGATRDIGELATWVDNRHRYGTAPENKHQYRSYADHVNGTWREKFANLFGE